MSSSLKSCRLTAAAVLAGLIAMGAGPGAQSAEAAFLFGLLDNTSEPAPSEPAPSPEPSTEPSSEPESTSSTQASSGPIASFKGTGPRVVLVGDSNSVNAKMPYEGKTKNVFSTSYNAVSGTTMREHQRELEYAATLDPRATVIALITNDSNPGRNPCQPLESCWVPALDALRRQGNPDCTVAVKPYLGANPSKDPRAATWHYLAPLLASYGVKVFDWDKIIRAKSPRVLWILADDLHYTASGNDEYAKALRDAALMC